MDHFFAAPSDISEGKISIKGIDINHIRNVLRKKPGDKVLISDGEGSNYICRIEDFSKDAVLCDIISEDSSGSEPGARFFLFQCLPKADKLEQVIQKSVELGVFEIIPVLSSRSIVKYAPEKQKAKNIRWQKISESAAKQSLRGIIPEVKEIMTFKEAVKYAAGLDAVLVPYENFKDVKATKDIVKGLKHGMSIGIFVGPEGGFDPSEVSLLCSQKEDGGASGQQISLGSRILRTETAPLMILSVLMFELE